MRKYEEWTIAYRTKLEGATLLDDQTRPFKIIPNTWRYWCADPHLLDFDGHTYVFAELYDRVLRRGVIGCCEITEAGTTPWKIVLRMPWHLSYPHVFIHEDTVYMIPESYVGREIALYKAVSFPNHWEKVRVLRSDYVAVDSTLFFDNDSWWMMSQQLDGDQTRLELSSFKDGVLSTPAYVVTQNDDNVRPAGKLFHHNGKLVRPAQDCTGDYGRALNLYHVTKLAADAYEETLFMKILPSSIHSDLGCPPQGIHTYNTSDRYEVIDLKEYKVDLLAYVMRPVWFVWRRVQKIFRR